MNRREMMKVGLGATVVPFVVPEEKEKSQDSKKHRTCSTCSEYPCAGHTMYDLVDCTEDKRGFRWAIHNKRLVVWKV